jgi:hypothetical protein
MFAPVPRKKPVGGSVPLTAALLAGVLLTAVTACSSPEPESGIDNARSAPAEVFRLPSGPLREVRISRDTDGRFVVSGICYFPEDTRLTLVLHDSLGVGVTRTRPVVANGLFDSLPLGAEPGQTLPPGRYEIEISVLFGPQDQPADVLRETDNGRALTGEGMFTTKRGSPAFSKRFPVEP